MVRRYLNRREESRYRRPEISAEDEWSHITEIGPHLDIEDVMDVQERKFFLTRDQELKTQWEKTKEATRDAMDRAGNTSQFIKYVNNYLKKRNAKLDDVKKLKEQFDEELSLLGYKKQKNDFLETIHNHNNEELKEVRKHLEVKKSITKKYLNKLKHEIWETENDLQNQEEEIRQIDRHIVSNGTEEIEPHAVRSLKDKVISLCKEYDPETICNILDELEESLKSKLDYTDIKKNINI